MYKLFFNTVVVLKMKYLLSMLRGEFSCPILFPNLSSEKIENQRNSEAVYTWPILYPNRRLFLKFGQGAMTDGSVTSIFIN